MKKTKILVPALAVLALGMAASVTGTVAWFAANNVVNANGMFLKSTTPSSLVISKAITASGIGDATSIDYQTAANDPSIVLNPASHFTGTSPEGNVLKNVNNGNDVDPVTGLAMRYVAENHLGTDAVNNNTGAATPDGYRDLTYVDCDANGHYYKDFVCYLGSVGKTITIGEGGYLQVSINWGDTNQTTEAATVDFYVNKTASTSSNGIGNYAGCLNAAGIVASSAHAGAPIAEYAPTTSGEGAEYVTLLGEDDELQVNTGDTFVKVTMRVYLDGALLEDAGHTFIRTNEMSTDGITVDAVFSLSRGTQD